MSSEADKQKIKGRDIPHRRVVLNDISQLPSEYSTTPGGTFFSTTPGGMSWIPSKCIVFFDNSTFGFLTMKTIESRFVAKNCR